MSANSLWLVLQPVLISASTILLACFGASGFLQELKADTLVKLLIAVTMNFVLMYLLEFGAYLLSLPPLIPVFLYVAVSLASAFYAYRRGSITKNRIVAWEGVLAWLGLASWILVLQSRIVVYGGGFWFGDWFFHYERALFFVERLPPSTLFLGYFTLPGWGPLFNAATAFLMNLFGSDFWIFQIIATALNTFLVLPLALLLRDIAGIHQKTSLLLSTLILSLLPYAIQMETYTWTKSFAAALILAGVYLYRKSVDANSIPLLLFSFLTFSAAILTHYLAFPFAMFFAFHLVYRVVQKKQRSSILIKTAALSGLALFTWFGYVFITFGIKSAFTATTSFGSYYEAVHEAQKTDLPDWSTVFVNNTISTLLPYSLRHGFRSYAVATPVQQIDARIPESLRPPPSPETDRIAGYQEKVNDLASLTGAIGWTGLGCMMLIAIHKARSAPKKRQNQSPGFPFWLVFFSIGIPLNIFFSRDYSPTGVAHLNLQPYILLAIVWILHSLKNLHISMRIAAGCFFLTESVLGIRAIVSLWSRALPLVLQSNGRTLAVGKFQADPFYVNNFVLKLRGKCEFLSDRLGPCAAIFPVVAVALSVLALYAAYRFSRTGVTD